MKMRIFLFVLLMASVAFGQQDWQARLPKPVEGDFTAHNFRFHDGESLPELKVHYTTYGRPAADSNGRVTNAVLILHGTTGSGHQFVREQFAGYLFGPGQLLDATKYYIILPDSIGHGKSSKPSDGMHAHFPHYDYNDMVAAQHLLLTDGLKVNHLRLVMGTSMGCMHSWVWLETYPEFMDAAMPLACQPVEIAGRNRMMRKMIMDDIVNDPDYNHGDYTHQLAAMRNVYDVMIIMGSSPLQMQKNYPTQQQADAYLKEIEDRQMATSDPNDVLYAFDASRTYDPSGKLDQIKVPVMFVNSADDQINPPELGIAEREIKKVKRGKFVLLPITDQTRGHGTHTLPAVWHEYLEQLLNESK